MLAQAKSAQPRASTVLRARVKENVLRAVAAADLPASSPSATGLSKSAFAGLPVWTFPTLGAIAVIGGIAAFAAQRSSDEPSQRAASVAPLASQGRTIALQPSVAQREAKAEQGSPVEQQPLAERRVVSTNTHLPEGAIELRATLGEARAERRSARAASQSRQLLASESGAPTARRASPIGSLVQTPSAAESDAPSVAADASPLEQGAAAADPRAQERRPRASQPTRRGGASAREPSSALSQPSQEREDASARARDSDLRAEMQLLGRAEAALRANEPLSALAILETHARELTSGQLRGELAGLRLIAQCTLGRDPQSALTRYLHEHRDGVLQARIRASCARFLP
jgi:hypothetical protein